MTIYFNLHGPFLIKSFYAACNYTSTPIERLATPRLYFVIGCKYILTLNLVEKQRRMLVKNYNNFFSRTEVVKKHNFLSLFPISNIRTKSLLIST